MGRPTTILSTSVNRMTSRMLTFVCCAVWLLNVVTATTDLAEETTTSVVDDNFAEGQTAFSVTSTDQATSASTIESANAIQSKHLPENDKQALSAGDTATTLDSNHSKATDDRYTHNRSVLRTGALVAKEGYEGSEEDKSDKKHKKKKHKDNSLLYFLYSVSNRTALCTLLNGTCVAPHDCAIQKLAFLSGYGHGHGGYGKPKTSSFDCNLTTICCYPYLLTGLFDFTSGFKYHNDDSDDSSEKHHSSDDSDDHKPQTGYSHAEPYGYGAQPAQPVSYDHVAAPPAPQSYPAVVPLHSYSKPSHNGRRSRRRQYGSRRRSKRRRRRRRSSKHGFFFDGHFGDVTNRTALCLLRNGVCVAPSDCATNSAVGIGSNRGYGGLLSGGGAGYHSDNSDHEIGYNSGHQIRSFLCNLTTLCCLPEVNYYAGLSLGGYDDGSSSSDSSHGREGPAYRELAPSSHVTRRSERRRRRNNPSLPVGNIHATTDAERSALCSQVNGTCLVPNACETSGYYGTAHSLGYLNFHCNLTSICCLPAFNSVFGLPDVGFQLSST